MAGMLKRRSHEHDAKGQSDGDAQEAQERAEPGGYTQYPLQAGGADDYCPRTDGEMADPKEVLVDSTQGKPRPVPDEEESADNDGSHASDVQDLIEIAPPASQAQDNVGERRRKQPLCAKDQGRQPDEVPVVLPGSDERKVRWSRGYSHHESDR